MEDKEKEAEEDEFAGSMEPNEDEEDLVSAVERTDQLHAALPVCPCSLFPLLLAFTSHFFLFTYTT
jgi:hypothetical protein